MSKTVADTNVLVVANRASPQATLECEIACVNELIALRKRGLLVLDRAGEILAIYANHCSFAGQPGVGDEFFRWAHDNAYTGACYLVDLVPTGEGYEQFPDSEELRGFDADDRIFVAAALASEPVARIINAVDSDYSHHRAALEAHGLRVHELCPDLLKAESNAEDH